MSGFSFAVSGLNARVIVEQAVDTLRNRCAPEIGSLADNPLVPDSLLNILLEWADDLCAGDPWAAFDIKVLADVLPALNTVLLSCYSFSPEAAPKMTPRGLRVDLVLDDAGGAHLVETTRACASILAVVCQGAAGEALVKSANDKLSEAMDEISAALARQY